MSNKDNKVKKPLCIDDMNEDELNKLFDDCMKCINEGKTKSSKEVEEDLKIKYGI